MEQSANGCGLQLDTSPGALVDRYLLLIPLSQPSDEDIKLHFGALTNLTDRQRGRLDELAPRILERIRHLGHARQAIDLESVAYSRTAVFVFLDWDRVAPDSKRAVVDYGIISGLASLPMKKMDEAEDGYSFFFSNGTIEQAAGRDEDRYEKHCRVLPVIKGICDGNANAADITEEQVDEIVARASSQCSGADGFGQSLQDMEERFQDLWRRSVEPVGM